MLGIKRFLQKKHVLRINTNPDHICLKTFFSTVDTEQVSVKKYHMQTNYVIFYDAIVVYTLKRLQQRRGKVHGF